jgi:23S rRNA (uracil1939-C5)-methyltransferase
VHETLPPAAAAAITAVEIAENIPETERAVHVDMQGSPDRAAWAVAAEGLTGLTVQGESRDPVVIAGVPAVTDLVAVAAGAGAPILRLTRPTTAFFQANRFLLPSFVQHVASLTGDGPLLDLYAGVGLFGLAATALGRGPVTLVEGDRVSGDGLETNAGAFAGQVRVLRRSVEAALADPLGEVATCIVDPPRTGLSPEARAGVVRLGPRRVVYVSCDVATLARDARVLVDGGYALGELRVFDMFPSTAHLETVAVFDRR